MLQRRSVLKSATVAAGLLCPAALLANTDIPNDDASLVEAILLSLHPGLYRYLSPRAFAKNYAVFKQEFNKNDETASQYLALSKLLGTIRCGHSYANFYNQSDAVQKKLFDRGTRLPFAFRWIGQQMVVTKDHSGTGMVQPGTIINAINGLASRRILAQLMPYARADGHNDAKRRTLLSVASRGTYESFDIFHGLIFGAPKKALHIIDVTHPSGKSARVEMAPITLQQRQSFLKSAPLNDAPLWDWRSTADEIAILKMDSWGLYNSKWQWQAWLDEKLNTLNTARGLIIDLRENEGGLDCGNPILARFVGSDLTAQPINRLLRFKKTPAALNPYLDTWDDSFRDWGASVSRYDDRYFKQNYDLARDVITAKSPQLKIPMVILISAENSSATFQFAQRARMAGVATLIGETTGGNRRGINGASFFFVRLPKSGLEFDLPLIGSYPTSSQPDEGLRPDIEIATDAADITHGRDRAMQTAIKKILLR
jgi:Peptidase family S41